MKPSEVIHKLEFMRDAYQKLIDENIDEGRLVSTDVTGTWKADTPLNEVYREHVEALDLAISALEKQEQDRWIPFKCRDATDDDCASFDYIMKGHLPEDGQTILITIKPDGHEPVQVDTYYGGGGEECYLDSGYSLCDEAIAWRPLPEPYTEEEK